MRFFGWSFGQGIKHDLKARIPLYKDDWRQGIHFKIISSIIYMFFTSIAPAISFGEYLTEETKGSLGVVEVLLSTGVSGVLFALLGGQPLIIVGVTGPVVIFAVTTFQLAKALNMAFVPFLSWVGIWGGLFHMILALVNASRLIRLVTRFSAEIFGSLIGVIYVYTAIEEIVIIFLNERVDSAVFSLLICFGTFLSASFLAGAIRWTIFNYRARTVIADYGPAVAIILWTAVQFIPPLDKIDLTLTKVPKTFQTTSGRPWLVFLEEGFLDPITIAIAVPAALLLTVLFFFDHNVSSLLCQVEEFHLQKPAAFHWDFFVVGIIMFVCSLLGIPFTNGLIPQAYLHSRSLSHVREEVLAGRRQEIYENIYENRVSALVHALLIGIMVSPGLLSVIGVIPTAGLAGIFLLMGLQSFEGNQLAIRAKLLITEKANYPTEPWVVGVPHKAMVKFTLIQLFFVALIFGITLTPYVAIVFPLFIAVLIPLRLYVLKRYFEVEHLAILDPYLSRAAEREEQKEPTELPKREDSDELQTAVDQSIEMVEVTA